MIGLNTQRTNGPSVGLTDLSNFLLDTRRDLPGQNTFAVF
jgi:hypothetical protein